MYLPPACLPRKCQKCASFFAAAPVVGRQDNPFNLGTETTHTKFEYFWVRQKRAAGKATATAATTTTTTARHSRTHTHALTHTEAAGYT